VRRDQIEWFKDKSDSIVHEGDRHMNGLAFMHHPLQEHMTLANHFPIHG